MDTLMRNELLSNRKKILNLDEYSSQENSPTINVVENQKLNIVVEDNLFSENTNDEYIEIEDKNVKHMNYTPDFNKLNNTIKLMENSINSKNRLYASLTILGMLGLFVINDILLIHFF